MNIFNVILSIIIFGILSYLDIAILQSQYYENKRFILHKIDKLKDHIAFHSILFAVIAISIIIPILLPSTYYISYLVPVILLLLTTKTKLKFTRRSITLLLIANLLNISLILTYYFLLPYFFFFFSLSPLLHLIFSMLSNKIELPIEKIIQRHYFKLAKRKLASCHDLKIIGITGSYGKTTVKYFLKQLLIDLNPLATEKNINTPLGLCRFINENISIFDHYLILELGIDRVGGMKKFKKFLSLDYAVITAVDKQHIRTFKSLENIKKEKLAIQTLLKKGGTLFYNSDCLQISNKLGFIKYVPVSKKDYTILPNKCISFSSTDLCLPVLSNGIIYDAFLSYIISINFINKERINTLIKTINLPERRKKIYKRGNLIVIDDSYNINLTSVKDDILLMRQYKKPYQVVTSGLVEINNEKNMLIEFFNQLNISDYIFFNRKLTKKESLIVKDLNMENKIIYNKNYLKEGTMLILTYGTNTTLH